MSDTDFNPFEQYFDRSEAQNILKNTCSGADDGEFSSNAAGQRI